ncbi:MAG: FAD-dependent monooxygenase [Zetaproteobacteria bacterium]|nr:FAD-dependent monooxygenase [Zetaproteobacteria bacterium]
MKATVLGAGFAGCLVTYLLKQMGIQVSLVERAPRDDQRTHMTPGIPQSAHVHVLLSKGLHRLQHTYADFKTFLDQHHVPEFDWGAETHWYSGVYKAPSYPSGIRTRCFSRPLLDRFMWQQARACATEYLHDEGTIHWPGTGQPAQVHLKTRGTLKTDIVVDCRGRNSQLPSLSIRTEKQRTSVNYRTRVLIRETDTPATTQFYQQPAPPHHPYGALYGPIEDGKSILTTIGIGNNPGKQPLTTLLSRMEAAEISQVQRILPTSSATHKFCHAQNVWFHFGRNRRWPSNLFVLGDAACRFNPAYGQGMTVASEGAFLLQQCLREGRSTRWFQRQLDRCIYIPWQLSSESRLIHWLRGRMLATAFRQPQPYQDFLRVLHFFDPQALRRLVGQSLLLF